MRKVKINKSNLNYLFELAGLPAARKISVRGEKITVVWGEAILATSFFKNRLERIGFKLLKLDKTWARIPEWDIYITAEIRLFETSEIDISIFGEDLK